MSSNFINLHNAQKRRFRPVVQIDPETEQVVAEYPSIADAARAVHGNPGSIWLVAAGKYPTVYKSIWRFKENM